MKVSAPAKINLSLHIKGRRDDGYHDLTSEIDFLDIGDDIEITLAEAFKYDVTGPFKHHLPKNSEDDLSVKAVRLFERHTNIKANVHIKLVKNIPAGAGLGGGSSDAAAVLKALNAIYDAGISADAYQEMSLELGSELPVCMALKPSRVTGRGENVEGVRRRLSGYVVLVWPNVVTSTSDVFGAYNGETDTQNDLKIAAQKVTPEIRDVFKFIERQGIVPCLNGSGSTCYAVFDNLVDAKRVEGALKEKFPPFWIKVARPLRLF